MGKVVGLVGAASGKIGNVVYAVTNGIQTARVYQPIVSNPKSATQRLQRAKANVVGQVSKITPWQILTGLGANRRARRSRFLKLAMNAATSFVSSDVPGGVVAKLDAPDYVFSEGALNPLYAATAVQAQANSIVVTVTRSSGSTSDLTASSGCLLVVVLLAADGKYERVQYRMLAPVDLPTTTTSVTFYHTPIGDYEANVYTAPFATADGRSLTAIANELAGDHGDFTAMMQYNPAALPLEWGMSRLDIQGEYKA